MGKSEDHYQYGTYFHICVFWILDWEVCGGSLRGQENYLKTMQELLCGNVYGVKLSSTYNIHTHIHIAGLLYVSGLVNTSVILSK